VAMSGDKLASVWGISLSPYIADRFAKLGLKPGGDTNTYLQTIKFIVEQVSPESSFKASDTSFKHKEDFVVFPPKMKVSPGFHLWFLNTSICWAVILSRCQSQFNAVSCAFCEPLET
jgi:hypothetical protein